MNAGVLASRLRIPAHCRENIIVERLAGLTNVNHKLTTSRGSYVLRLPGKDTSRYINRAAECHNARVAANAGVNADVAFFDSADGTMLTKFLPGATMTPARFKSEATASIKAAHVFRRIHRLGPQFQSRFEVGGQVLEYERMLRSLGAPLPAQFDEAARGVRRIHRALSQRPIALSPSHNDPWPGNWVEAGEQLFLLDWEYSGMNDPMWDLADLSVEADLAADQDLAMLEAYYGGAVSAVTHDRMVLYKALSDYLWSVWAMVQQATDNPAEDFIPYAFQRLERCERALGDAELGRRLEAVARAEPAGAPVGPQVSERQLAASPFDRLSGARPPADATSALAS